MSILPISPLPPSLPLLPSFFPSFFDLLFIINIVQAEGSRSPPMLRGTKTSLVLPWTPTQPTSSTTLLLMVFGVSAPSTPLLSSLFFLLLSFSPPLPSLPPYVLNEIYRFQIDTSINIQYADDSTPRYSYAPSQDYTLPGTPLFHCAFIVSSYISFHSSFSFYLFSHTPCLPIEYRL